MNSAPLQLWAHLYDSERGTLAVWSTGGEAQGPDGPRTKYFDYPTRAKDAADHARKESETGREAYFCTHLLTAQRRTKENAAPVRALWNEYDGAEVPNGSLKPTALVASSPGRFHAYWRLTDAIPPETAEDLNERIAQATGADPSGFDLSQLLRVPGTTNHKYEDLPVVRLVGINNEHEYVPADLHNSLPEKKREKFTKAGPVGERILKGERNKGLASIAGTMRRRGMGEAEILAALQVTNARRCSPPLEADEVEKIAVSVARYEPAGEVISISVNGHGSPPQTPQFNLTDLGNSARLIAHHGADLRYCYPWGRWLVWDGRRWSVDNSGEVHRRAKRTVKEIYREAAGAADDETRKALAKHAVRSESENRIHAMISLAKSEVPAMPEELDRDPWLLNVSNGTLDLRDGNVLEHSREDLITKLAPVEYDPDAEAPTWAAVLERTIPSEPVRKFFKKLCGRAFSGDVSEHVLPVLYGTGANGKSTILNALLEAAGDYGMQAAPDLLIAKRDNHPTEVADLFGMRFVASIEVEDGRRLAESLVKTLTGGDKVRARRMRQDFWEFSPTHKVFMAVNHKPQVKGNDNAIWRRIRLLPFEQTIPPAEQDKKLPEKLRAELPGILAWAVEGCLEWRQSGLDAPDEVRKATGRYRSEMDVLGAFLKDCCEEEPEHNVAAKDLYTRYKTWCDENGETTEKQRTFGSKLSERGYERYRGGVSGGHRWRGLTLCDVAFCRGSDPTDPQVPIAASKTTHVERNVTLGSEGSEGSVEPPEEQRRRIDRLVRQGMAEHLAQEEVAGQ